MAPAAAAQSCGFDAASTWARLVVPSFSDCFFIFLFVWLFLAGPHGWDALLGDADIGWHLRTGEWILANHAVPSHDLFSFTRAGAPWFAWEWLSDIVFALLFRAASFKGVLLLTGLVIGIYSTIVLRHAFWRGANAMVALPLTLLGVGSSTVHFLARPHVFTLLFMASAMWLVEADRKRATPWLWALIPLSALWVNLHGGFFMFLACSGVVAAGSAVETWLGAGSWRSAQRYALLFAGCAAASVVNPYGIELHKHVLAYLSSDWIRNNIQEFLAPTFRSEGQRQFELVLLLGLLTVAPLLRKRRITEALLILFLAHSSLTSLRHATIFCVVAIPIMAEEISSMWRGIAMNMPRKSLTSMLNTLGADLAKPFRRSSLWPAAMAVAVAMAPIAWPQDFPKALFPTALVSRHAERLQAARVLTTDQWGDYLIFRFYPRERVYIDGRSDFYGEQLGNEYLHVLQLAPDWEKKMAQRRFDAVMLPPSWPLVQMLKSDAKWRIAEDTGAAVLFFRRGAEGDAARASGSPRASLVLKKTRADANENLQSRRSLYTGDRRNERG